MLPFCTLLATLALGTPVAFSLALAGIVYILITGEYLSGFSSQIFAALNSGTLLSIPFFILSAEILNRSGATDRLIKMIDAWVGHNPGGLPVVAVIATAFFSAICGSSAATAAAIGAVVIPEMIKRGYKPEFSVGLVAAAGGLGILIPPSIPLIIYGLVTETSVAMLFKAALFPGMMLASLLIAAAFFVGRRSGVAPTPRQSWSIRWATARGATGVLLMPVVVLGGIYSGIFTATESSAIACAYALGLAIFNLRTPIKDVPAMLTVSASTAGMILLIIAGAQLFSYTLTAERIPHRVFEFISAQQWQPYVLLGVLMVFYIFAGMFLEIISIILITMPILVPVLNAAGIDLIHFSILLTINMELAVITPPIGLNLFIVSAIAKVPVVNVFRGTLPFALVILAFLIAMTFVPYASFLTIGR